MWIYYFVLLHQWNNYIDVVISLLYWCVVTIWLHNNGYVIHKCIRRKFESIVLCYIRAIGKAIVEELNSRPNFVNIDLIIVVLIVSRWLVLDRKSRWINQYSNWIDSVILLYYDPITYAPWRTQDIFFKILSHHIPSLVNEFI